MSDALDLRARARVPLLIAFADLTRFTVRTQQTPDDVLAEVMDAFYRLVSERVREGDGRVVKFMGDGVLMVFGEAEADAGVLALLALKEEADRWLADRGWDSRMLVRVHFGDVVAGPFGGAGDARFDVLGRNVNAAARLESRGFALSAQAFRKLAPETRTRFKKHTPPITYIRVEDRHR